MGSWEGGEEGEEGGMEGREGRSWGINQPSSRDMGELIHPHPSPHPPSYTTVPTPKHTLPQPSPPKPTIPFLNS